MKGLRVDEIQNPSGNAAKAGVMIDDILIKVNNQELSSVDNLIAIMQRNEGQKCQLELISKGDLETITITAGSLGLSLIPVDIEYKYYEATAKETSLAPAHRVMSEHEFSRFKDNVELSKRLEHIQLTTAPSLEGYRVVKTITIIGVEYSFGMDELVGLLPDSVKDFSAQSNKVLQLALRNAREHYLLDLKLEAEGVGANAAIAVSIHNDYMSGPG